jgi:glycosyltransferase involved in cell wall biosynthesis
MGCPRISIVTPSFNQGKFLSATLESVLGQGYPALEYAVMDGGSEDNSVEVIKQRQAQLSFWRSGPDRGQAALPKNLADNQPLRHRPILAPAKAN